MRDPQCVILSGPMFSGKSSLAAALADAFDFTVVSARMILLSHGEGEIRRRSEMQALGEKVEERTKGKWLADAVKSDEAVGGGWIVDAARTKAQVDRIIEFVRPAMHIHLTASVDVRRSRFDSRASEAVFEDLGFDEASSHKIERSVDDLSSLADLVLDSSDASMDILLNQVLTQMSTET